MLIWAGSSTGEHRAGSAEVAGASPVWSTNGFATTSEKVAFWGRARGSLPALQAVQSGVRLPAVPPSPHDRGRQTSLVWMSSGFDSRCGPHLRVATATVVQYRPVLYGRVPMIGSRLTAGPLSLKQQTKVRILPPEPLPVVVPAKTGQAYELTPTGWYRRRGGPLECTRARTARAVYYYL